MSKMRLVSTVSTPTKPEVPSGFQLLVIRFVVVFFVCACVNSTFPLLDCRVLDLSTVTAKAQDGQTQSILSAEFCYRLGDESLHRQREHSNSPTNLEFNDHYYLTKPILERGLVKGKLQPSFLQKMANPNQQISVLTLGGSFTRGHGCGETIYDDERQCSWPFRFEKWWRTHLTPHLRQHHSNWHHGAEHGSDSAQALQRIGVMMKTLQPDLVILDYFVNDVAQQPPEKGTVAHEGLLRAIMEIASEAQILLMEAGCPDCVGNPKMWFYRRQIARHYDIPVIDYAAMVDSFNTDHDHDDGALDRLWPFTPAIINPDDKPFILEGLQWPNFLPLVNTTKKTCCPLNHPPWPVHQYISDSVAYGMVQLLKSQGCPKEHDNENGNGNGNENGLQQTAPSFYHSNDLDRFSSCTVPLTSHDALLAFDTKHNNIDKATTTEPNRPHFIFPDTSHGWDLYEDRPGRPGWIATSTKVDSTNNSITFPIRLGKKPTVAITFLRSYASLGTAEVSFTSREGTKETVTLNGRWDQNYSLPHTSIFIGRPDAVAGVLLAPLENDGYDIWNEEWQQGEREQEHDYEIDISLVSGDKFKILSVLSC